MNALDFVTQTEFNYAKYKFDKRESFELGKKYKNSKGYIEIKIKSSILDKKTQADLIEDIWNGEDYLVFVDKTVGRASNFSGSGCPYSYSEFKKYFESFDVFVNMVNQLLKEFEDFEETQVQLSLF